MNKESERTEHRSQDGPDKRRRIDSHEILCDNLSGPTESSIKSESQSSNDRYDVCFGMIYTDFMQSNGNVSEEGSDLRVEVSLKVINEMMHVQQSSSGNYLGILNVKTAKTLTRLLDRSSVKLVAFALIDRRANLTKGTTRRSVSQVVHIVVYGFNEESNTVGDSLADGGIFLQHPLAYDENIHYDNPQYLKRPGSSIELPESAEVKPLRGKSPLTSDKIAKIFQRAQGPPIWSDVNASTRLKTQLKTHQKMGLAMMVEKEKGDIEGKNDFATLWSLIFVDDNQKRYKNAVTGSIQRERPQVCSGGLLADEMGLGKTLTVLALIAGSLDCRENKLENNQLLIRENERNCSMTTLIITPKSTLQTWDEQIEKHITKGSLRVHVYHGQKRASTMAKLSEFDVVITTYATLCVEFSTGPRCTSKRQGLLQSCVWHRVVLDEAHEIRDRSTKQSRAVCSLESRYRWCLTGTPIQNRVEDFGALLLFLRVHPFHTKSVFDGYIANPINAQEEIGMQRLQLLVSSTALRRTKVSVGDELRLAPRNNSTIPIVLTAPERELYENKKRRALQVIDEIYRKDEKTRGYYSILSLILELRQICDYGMNSVSHTASELPSEIAICEWCNMKFEPHECEIESSILPCMHVLCASCLLKDQSIMPVNEIACPLCLGKTPFEGVKNKEDVEYVMKVERCSPSSKILALLENLRTYQCVSAKKPIKSVVFSCWTKMLDLLEQTLCSEGFGLVRIDGNKNESQRRAAIEKFRIDDNCTILLASIGTCGVGLDLTVASRVHLMEPQWNPMAEEQALDRVHRMGQELKVHAIRYIVKDSIEEYVLKLQRAKIELFQQSFGADAMKKESLKMERLRKLRAFLE